MGTLLHSCETNVTGVTSLVEREQSLAQIEKLVSSHVLHGSESLCKLLRYLAKHALDHPGTPIKEYQIATEVFGRSDDFDPQLDSMVRVQAGRLRGKLAEYYSANGTDDSVVVELPKGTYVLAFHHRAHGARPHLSPPNETEWRANRSHKKSVAAKVLTGVALVLAAATILWLVLRPDSVQARLSREGAVAPAALSVVSDCFGSRR